MKKLNVLSPNYRPRATEYIPEMIKLVELLLKNGHAYIADKQVLFDVDSMPNYGFLSGRSMKEMVAGARVEIADYKRIRPTLFYGNHLMPINLGGIVRGVMDVRVGIWNAQP